MKNLSDTQRLWFYRGLTLLVTAILVHLAAVWAAPRVIMQILMNGPMAKTMNMYNQAAYPPAVTAASRTVVMPSPDMLYSVCTFDLRAGPLQITADPKLSSYWSIALYGANSDNFHVVNDHQAAGKAVSLWVVADAAAPAGAPQPPAGSTVVVSPSATGFVLMRVLTGNYDAEKDMLEPARRTFQCTSAAKA